MTPQDYLNRLQELVGAERYREALALASTHQTTLRRQLTQAERAYLHGVMEVAAAAVEALDRDVDRATPTGLNRMAERVPDRSSA